ncbi:CBU_0592 family membrane protein [Nocardioides marmoribigeumensis]|jgi:hypothetical protein|uniref:CBU-0592-like domain-containing protein n=1 Tax=Nocardioides marmoribigeumensis TaxID=433649 RepID=A0ABU2BWL8_9ACTN|nr:hypothetical protein [Nocardioides marmoribigeumensis]MDR7362846.1 hypothetical protein [Nocardioides marmoribigeumensis]
MIAASLGWMGTIGTMLAYVLMANGRLVATSRTYAAMNVAGGVLAGVGAMAYAAWPSVASNVMWAAIGAWSFLSATRVAHARRTA